MKILNFGSCNIDYVYTLDHIVAAGETEQSLRRDVFPGGKGLNQSIALSRAGAHVYHAGCVGSDGGLLLETLSESGADLKFMRTVDAPSGHAVIQVSKTGENSIFILTGANGMFDRDYIDRVLLEFGEGDLLILQNEINNIPYIIDRACEKGMTVIFNPSPMNETILSLDLDKIGCLVLNEIEGEYLTCEKEPAKIISALRRAHPALRAALTLGAQGCLYHDGARLLFQPAFEVKAVDTTAAGDTFTGYFVAGLAAGLQSAQILEFACAASAIAVSRMGAAPSIPRAEEVRRRLPQLRQKASGSGRNKNGFLKKAEEYFSAHLCDADLPSLSALLGYSPVYTGHLLKQYTGKSFSALLQEKRCSFAAKLLVTTDLPVSQIIHQSGYSNEGFFRKKFVGFYGVSPLEYRNAMMKKAQKKEE